MYGRVTAMGFQAIKTEEANRIIKDSALELRHTMKNLMLLTISLALLIAVSSNRTWAQDGCTLAQALEFHTALGMAEFYFGTADSSTYQNGQIYKTEIIRAADRLSDACLIELLTAKEMTSVRCPSLQPWRGSRIV